MYPFNTGMVNGICLSSGREGQAGPSESGLHCIPEAPGDPRELWRSAWIFEAVAIVSPFCRRIGRDGKVEFEMAAFFRAEI
jgi:hypothetical protein